MPDFDLEKKYRPKNDPDWKNITNCRHSRISRGRNQLRGPFGELLMEEMAKSGSRSSPSKSSPSSSLLPSSPTFPLLPSSSPIPSPGTYQSSIISSLLAPLHNYNVSILSEPSKGNFKKCLWCFWLY